MPNVTRTLILLLGLTGCGGSVDCPTLPCPPAMAVNLTVTSAASGAPIDSASVTVTGAETGSSLCNGTCIVDGGAGTYVIQVTAPGFASAQRTVKVTGDDPKCGCASADTQNVTIALVASD